MRLRCRLPALRFILVVVVSIAGTARPGPAQNAPKLSEDAARIQGALDQTDTMRSHSMLKELEQKGASAVPLLIELLDSSDRKGVREWAAELLRRLGPAGRPAIPALVRCLARPMDRAALIASRALSDHGAVARAELLEAVRGADPRLTLQAGELLVELKVERAALAEALLRHLRDGEGESRVVAAWLLGRLSGPVYGLSADTGHFKWPAEDRPAAPPCPAGPPEIGASLAAALAHDPDPRVRLAAVESIAKEKSHGAEGVLALRLLLKDADEGVRTAAAQAFAEIGPTDVDALNALCLAANRPSGPASLAAIRALARMGPAGRERLERLAESRHSAIRTAAAEAILELDRKRIR